MRPNRKPTETRTNPSPEGEVGGRGKAGGTVPSSAGVVVGVERAVGARRPTLGGRPWLLPAMSGPGRPEPLPAETPLLALSGSHSVLVLQRGYAEPQGPGGAVRADGSVTLVLPRAWASDPSRRVAAPAHGDAETALEGAARGPILVDTGGPWARDALLEALAGQGVTPGDVTLVVGTHGHSDHIGNLGLFPRAALLVSHDFCLPGGLYLPHGLSETQPLVLGSGLQVWATPGHGGQRDVSVVVEGTSLGTVVVAGDVFERLGDEDSWQALSEDPLAQQRSREKVLSVADVVVPGHGAPFRVVRAAAESAEDLMSDDGSRSTGPPPGKPLQQD